VAGTLGPGTDIAACSVVAERIGFGLHRTSEEEGPVAKTTRLEDVLALVPLFRGLSKRQLKHVADLCEIGEYMANASIVKQGEMGDSFYVVLSGQAKVLVGKKFVARLLPGDHFGEIAVLDPGERTASVVSETPMTLAILHRAQLQRALRDEPELALHMMSELAKMFRRLSDSNTQ
jgi:CRP-like cAMP-binding protein